MNWSFYPVSDVDWKKQDKRLKDMAWRNLALRARSIQEINHHGGSRPWVQYIEEHIAKTGVKPSRGQLYIKFYKLDKGDEKDRKLAVNIFNY
ncbi:hypothetical protein LINPERPRIM_LOCUS20437 [Linum perenne]